MRPTPSPSKLSYRPDIDGLRAVAVSLVVLDHIRSRFVGGYIGVDVFFVISGYLISSMILSEMAAGTFSILTFYERRIRRILPALFAMMLFTACMAWHFFIPSEIEDFGRSLLAAIFSVSNMFFWHQAGYFDAPSLLKPLLHTWSLAVEEQFYIFFPVFLLVLRRWLPTRIRAAIWATAAISLACACIAIRTDPTAAFFLAPLRAWELLVGTILSQHYLPSPHGRLQRNFASITGLLLILLPALLYDATTPFPGLAAIPPCIGAALIIAAGETGTSLVGGMLTLRPVVFLGLISYSLYLWHWPILIFKDYVSSFAYLHGGYRSVKAAVVLASLAAAILSRRFVEEPFRHGRLRLRRNVLFGTTGVAVAALSSVAVFMVASHGMASRLSPHALAIARFSTFDPAAGFRQNVCFLGPPREIYSDFNPQVCLGPDPVPTSTAPNNPPRKQYLLLGDSHAAHLYAGLAATFPEIHFLQANIAGCKPYIHTDLLYAGACRQLADFIFSQWLPTHHVDAVLLAARWQFYDFDELGHTIAWLQQRHIPIVLFGPAIEYDRPLPSVIVTSLRDHQPDTIASHRSIEPEQIDRALATLARTQWHVHYTSMYENLCRHQVEIVAKSQPEAGGCPIYAAPEVPMLFDADHLTPQGATVYAASIRSAHQIPLH